jgi:multisubunit Na+/H+ antiporter MnhG subunit
MTAANLTIIAMLGIAVAVTCVCCLAMVIMGNVFARMHYLAPVTAVAMPALLVAVVVQEGWGQAALKSIIVLFVLFMVNAVLTHATARAARIRSLGQWQPGRKEHIPGTSPQRRV